MSLSMQDVARTAGVSASTVSRVLNRNETRVELSEATAERVRSAAAAQHYRPTPSARSLRTAETRAAGVIVHDLLHPLSAAFLRAVHEVRHARGSHVLVGNAASGAEDGRVLGTMLRPLHVDGILLHGDVPPLTGTGSSGPPSCTSMATSSQQGAGFRTGQPVAAVLRRHVGTFACKHARNVGQRSQSLRW